MKYLGKKFSVAVGSDDYRSKWERIFSAKPPKPKTTTAIRTFNCDLDAHGDCPRTHGMDWAHCDCECHQLAEAP